jgi:hypothetical protein
MFDHLKTEEFTALIEDGAISTERRAHAEACERCRETWKSLETVYAKVTTLDEDVLEPDWSEFRASVRDEMLSRAVQRQTAARRWAVWPLQPAAVWGFSLLMVVGITTGAFFWTKWPASGQPAATATVESISPDVVNVDPLIELQGIEAEMKAWSNHSVYEEIATLESEEAENLLQLLQAEGEGTFRGQ